MATHTIRRNGLPRTDITLELQSEHPILYLDEVIVHLNAARDRLKEELDLCPKSSNRHKEVMRIVVETEALKERVEKLDRGV